MRRASSTTAAIQCCGVPLDIGSELVASVTMTSSDRPDISDSACMPISAAARDSGTLCEERPIRRMLAPIAPDRFSVLAMPLATNARRRYSRACRSSLSQRPISQSTRPVNATANSASAPTPSAGNVGTSSSVFWMSGSGNSPTSCQSSHATTARNAAGTIQRRRANDVRLESRECCPAAVVSYSRSWRARRSDQCANVGDARRSAPRRADRAGPAGIAASSCVGTE